MNKLPDDYFLSVDEEMLGYLEKQGEECIRELYQSNQLNKENGYKLLSILIVGIGSSFLFLTQRQSFDFMGAGIAVFTAYWSLCAVYLVINVLSVHKRGLISSSPERLYTNTYKGITKEDFGDLQARGFQGEENAMAILRRYRLKALCETSDELSGLNERLSAGLTRARIATIITPACAIVISVFTYLFF